MKKILVVLLFIFAIQECTFGQINNPVQINLQKQQLVTATITGTTSTVWSTAQSTARYSAAIISFRKTGTVTLCTMVPKTGPTAATATATIADTSGASLDCSANINLIVGDLDNWLNAAVTAWTGTGSVTVYVTLLPLSSSAGGSGGGSGGTVTQGTAAGASGAWAMYITIPATGNPLGDTTNPLITGPAVPDSAVGAALNAGENPALVGTQGFSAYPAAVANAQKSTLATDLLRRLIVNPYTLPGSSYRFSGLNAAAMTDTSTTAVIAADANNAMYITALTAWNEHATVNTAIKIMCGASEIYRVPASAVLGGTGQAFPVGLYCTKNTALNCAAVTTGTSSWCSMSGYKLPE